MRQLRQRMNELEGEVADPGLADGSREDRKVELERRLRRVRAQQLSLKDAAVAAYVRLPSVIRVRYAQASWLLERELVRQIEPCWWLPRVWKPDGRVPEPEKERGLASQPLPPTGARSCMSVSQRARGRAWMLVQYWNDQVREVCWDMTYAGEQKCPED